MRKGNERKGKVLSDENVAFPLLLAKRSPQYPRMHQKGSLGHRVHQELPQIAWRGKRINRNHLKGGEPPAEQLK